MIGMASAADVPEPRAMSDVVREANHGVKAHWPRASALAKIANMREEGTGQLSLPVLPGTASRESWPSAWCTEGADRQQILVDMRDKSNRLLEGHSHEEETTSKSSIDIDVRGDTDESFEKEADYSVGVIAEQDVSRLLGFGATQPSSDISEFQMRTQRTWHLLDS